MLSNCATLATKKKGKKNNINRKDVAKIILQIRDKILKEPRIILSLYYSSSQRIIEFVNEDA